MRGVNEVSGVMYEFRCSGKEAVPVTSDFGPNGLQGCPGLGDHPQSFLLVSETWKYTYKYKSWSEGRLQPITFSEEQKICCSLYLVEAALYHVVIEEVKMEKCTIRVFDILSFFSWHRKCILC